MIFAAMTVVSVQKQADAQVAAATVSGPLVSVSQGNSPEQAMLNPSPIELEASGYIEEEYFIEGLANRYVTEGMETGAIIDTGHRYRSRFIVRRPRSASAFNGTVIIEWNNVTGSRDLDIDWWQSGAHLVRNGYAYIAVSAQRVGVEHLKNTRPQRYGSLDVSHDGMVTDDALSYDIFSAVARAVPREGGPLAQDVDILGGLRAETVLATGHSQSASRLAVYLNNVHPREPLFHGFMIHGGGGQIRDDQNVRIFKLMAETDMARRADSPQPDSHWFRQWEVAGSSHVDIPFELEFARMVALEAGRPTADVSPRSPGCELPAYSHVPFRHAMNAAFEHLRLWAKEGVLPPVAPRLEIVRRGPPVEFARDDHGNILGGIRLAAHAVPTATNTGMNSGNAFCRLYGSHQAFSREVLMQLYPDQQRYLDAVQAVNAANMAAGYLLEHDARETLAAARASGIGNW